MRWWFGIDCDLLTCSIGTRLRGSGAAHCAATMRIRGSRACVMRLGWTMASSRIAIVRLRRTRAWWCFDAKTRFRWFDATTRVRRSRRSWVMRLRGTMACWFNATTRLRGSCRTWVVRLRGTRTRVCAASMRIRGSRSWVMRLRRTMAGSRTAVTRVRGSWRSWIMGLWSTWAVSRTRIWRFNGATPTSWISTIAKSHVRKTANDGIVRRVWVVAAAVAAYDVVIVIFIYHSKRSSVYWAVWTAIRGRSRVPWMTNVGWRVVVDYRVVDYRGVATMATRTATGPAGRFTVVRTDSGRHIGRWCDALVEQDVLVKSDARDSGLMRGILVFVLGWGRVCEWMVQRKARIWDEMMVYIGVWGGRICSRIIGFRTPCFQYKESSLWSREKNRICDKGQRKNRVRSIVAWVL